MVTDFSVHKTAAASKPRVLVMAAAGNTGLQVALQLLSEGFPVNALVRREDARSERLKAQGANVIVGSFLDLDDMRKAMSGVKRAYFCTPPAEGYLRTTAVFATIAAEQKLEVAVVMSQWLSNPYHPALHTRECWLSDQLFALLPETAVITINPGFFADNELQAIQFAAMFGTMMMPYGAGLNAAPSNEDIGRVAAALLARPEGHEGKTYRITGPKLLKPEEIAAIVGKVLGRKVRYVNAPLWALAKVLQGMGFSDYLIAQTKEYALEYQRGTFAIGAPTDTVRLITGHDAEDYETTARRYAERLPKNTRSLPNVLKYIFLMSLWMMRPAPQTDRYLAKEDFIHPKHIRMSGDVPDWQKSHKPALSLSRDNLVTNN